MELIKITERDGQQVVSARELYEFLQVKRDFTNWCKQMFEYGFEEEKDFTPILAKSTGGRPSVDYALTLDTAKEISMLQRSDKGKQARQYFIACEKAALSIYTRELSRKELLQMALEAEEHKEHLQAQLTLQAPKVVFADAVSTSKTCVLIGELAKILKQNGIDMGQNRLFEWLRSNGFLISRAGTDYNMPTQKSMDMELFMIKETVITHSDHTSISKTPKVTGKGQVYFVNKFLNN